MNKEKKSEIKKYVICNLSIFGIVMAFSLLAMMLDMVGLPKVLNAIFGVVMIVPTFFSLIVVGKNRGTKLYKEYADVNFDDLHKETQEKLPYHTVVYNFLGFAAWSVIFTLVAVISKSAVMQYFVTVFEYPLFMILRACGLVSPDSVSPIILLLIVFMLFEIGAFMLGYFTKIHALKLQQRAIERELRSYDN